MVGLTREQRAAREAEAKTDETSESAAPAVTLDDIFNLIQDMSGRLQKVEDTQKEQADQLPTITPMAAPPDLGAARRRAFAEAHPGEDVTGSVQAPVTSRRGHGGAGQAPLGASQPRFADKQRVRIRPNAAKEGFPLEGDPFPEKYEQDSKGRKRITDDWRRWNRIFPEATDVFPRNVTWGDVLKMAKCDGVGEVRNCAYYSQVGQWKYKVYIKGMTRKIGDGFQEWELEAA